MRLHLTRKARRQDRLQKLLAAYQPARIRRRLLGTTLTQPNRRPRATARW